MQLYSGSIYWPISIKSCALHITSDHVRQPFYPFSIFVTWIASCRSEEAEVERQFQTNKLIWPGHTRSRYPGHCCHPGGGWKPIWCHHLRRPNHPSPPPPSRLLVHCMHSTPQRQGPQAQPCVYVQCLHDRQTPLQNANDAKEEAPVRAWGSRGQY